MVKRVFQLFTAVLCFSASVALAHDFTIGDIKIDHPWSRATVAGIPNGVAYFGLENKGDAADRLVSASSPVAKSAELHNHVMEGEVARMRHVDAIEIPAGGSEVLKPGGLHVMLMGLNEPLQEGQMFPLTLTFENAGDVTVEVLVQAMGKSKGEHSDHGSHDAAGHAHH